MAESLDSHEFGERPCSPSEQVRRWTQDLLTQPGVTTDDVVAMGIHSVDERTIVVAQAINPSSVPLGITYEFSPGGLAYALSVYESVDDYLSPDIDPIESITCYEDGTVYATMGYEDLELIDEREERAIITSFALRYHLSDLCATQLDQVH